MINQRVQEYYCICFGSASNTYTKLTGGSSTIDFCQWLMSNIVYCSSAAINWFLSWELHGLFPSYVHSFSHYSCNEHKVPCATLCNTHTVCVTRQKLEELHETTLQHSPYSLNLAPFYYYLFGFIKKDSYRSHICSRQFWMAAELAHLQLQFLLGWSVH